MKSFLAAALGAEAQLLVHIGAVDVKRVFEVYRQMAFRVRTRAPEPVGQIAGRRLKEEITNCNRHHLINTKNLCS